MASVRRQIDGILGRSLLVAESLQGDLRDRLIRELSEQAPFASDLELMGIADRMLSEFRPIATQALIDVRMAAAVLAASVIFRGLPRLAQDALSETGAGPLVQTFPVRPPSGPVTPVSLPGSDEPVIRFPLIERAAESLARRNVVLADEFQELSDQARAEAFTTVATNDRDTLRKIRNTLAETASEGASLRDFSLKLGQALEASPIGGTQTELIFRTNINQAFNDATSEISRSPVVEAVFPYRRYDAIIDGRTRPTHARMEKLGISGTALYRTADRAFWAVWTPLNGFNCRCGTTLVTLEGAAQAGVAEARRAIRTGRPLEPLVGSRLPLIPFEPDPGFGAPREVVAA